MNLPHHHGDHNKPCKSKKCKQGKQPKFSRDKWVKDFNKQLENNGSSLRLVKIPEIFSEAVKSDIQDLYEVQLHMESMCNQHKRLPAVIEILKVSKILKALQQELCDIISKRTP